MNKRTNSGKLNIKFSHVTFFALICIVAFLIFITNSLNNDEDLDIIKKTYKITQDVNVQINKSIEKINLLKVNEDNIRKEIKSKNSLEYFSNIVYIDSDYNAVDFYGEIEKIDDFVLDILKSDVYNKAKIYKNDEGNASMIYTCRTLEGGVILAYYNIGEFFKKLNVDDMNVSFIKENGDLLDSSSNIYSFNLLKENEGKVTRKKYESLKKSLAYEQNTVTNIKIYDKNSKVLIEKINLLDGKLICWDKDINSALAANNILKNTAIYSMSFLAMLIAMYIIVEVENTKTNKIKNTNTYIDKVSGISSIKKFRQEFNTYRRKNSDTDLVLISIDLDEFDLINKKHGYDFGNTLIKILGTTLKEILNNDGICARAINDTFLCLTKSSSKEIIESMMQEYMNKVRQKVELLNISLELSFAIGIVKIDKDLKEIDIEEYLNRAYVSRISIKERRDVTFGYYDSSLRRNAKNPKELRKDLEIAIKENQFKIIYQPKVEVLAEEIVSVEALIRWIHPTKGLINPGSFIEMAEKNGDIVKIDRIVLEEVCKTLNKWKKEDINLIPIAVNISNMQFSKKEYVEELINIVKKYNVNPKFIEFEITEMIEEKDRQNLEYLYKYINKIGISISNRDVEKNENILSVLEKTHLYFIKVDRSFIMDVETNEDSIEFLRSVVELRDKKNFKVVCEGVETKNQLQILKDEKCDIVQGYVYYKPFEQFELEKRLKIENLRKDLSKK